MAGRGLVWGTVVGVLLLLMLSSSAFAAPAAAATGQLRWHSIPTKSAPSAMDRSGLAYDPADGYAVLYGGYNAFAASPFSYETWRFSGGDWTQLSPTSHPAAPSGFVMGYDPSLRGVLQFGGEAPYGSAFYNATWLFNAGNWTQLHPTVSPPARSQYAMAYDPAAGAMMIFGGTDGGTYPRSDTWLFNGTTWTQVVTNVSPQGRQFGTLVYDNATGQMLLVGGENSTGTTLGATWAFSGGHWKILPHAHTPIRSFMYSAESANGTPVLFGGLQSYGSKTYNSTLAFLSGAWQNVHAKHAPSVRAIGPMTYDPRTAGLLLFGGVGPGYSYYNTTWVLR